MVVAVESVSQSNAEIMQTLSKTNDSFSDIVKLINEISQKTKVINDIVFQTKLLSFNASVEAARAGEHGKGFSVIAEAGKLAAMSGNSASEISKIIDLSIQKVDSIVKENKQSADKYMIIAKEKIANSQSVAMKCEKIFDEVSSNVNVVGRLIEEIAVASNEQFQGIEQITQAIDQINIATASNSQISNDVSQASKEMAGQSIEIDKSIKELNNTVYGNKGVS